MKLMPEHIRRHRARSPERSRVLPAGFCALLLALAAGRPAAAYHDLTVTVKNVSDQAVVSEVSWAASPSNWQEALQYLEISYQSNETGWGVQIYTDNHNGAADPYYTGTTQTGTEGAGLIGTKDTTVNAPMAWTALDAPGPRPTVTADGNGILISNNGWAYFKDKMQTTGSYPFTYGEDYIIIVNASGLAKNDGTGRNASAATPVAIYLIGNFRNQRNQLFQTNQLTVEMFHQ